MTTPPIFDVSGVTGAELLQCVNTRGAALIRGCMDGDAVSAMLARAEEAYAHWAGMYARGELDPAARLSYEGGHVSPGSLDRDDVPLAIISFLVRSHLSRVLSTLWGGNLLFLYTNCVPRRQNPGRAINVPVPFHQDAAFLGQTDRVLNFWVPLESCGVDAPGLEVVLAQPGGMVELKRADGDPFNADYSGIEIPEQDIVRRFGGEKLWHPEMQPGDVLVFSDLTIHRTYTQPGMARSRTSLEIRVTAGDNAAALRDRADLVPVRLQAKA